MNKEASKKGFQYCKKCNKQTLHTPKLGLVFKNKRLCTRCNTSNKIEKL